MPQNLFTWRILKKKYDLWPLITFIGLGCAMGAVFSVYSVVQKPDVRLNRWALVPPWEEVDPEKAQRILTYKQKYQKIPEVEQLRREIGSYQVK